MSIGCGAGTGGKNPGTCWAFCQITVVEEGVGDEHVKTQVSNSSGKLSRKGKTNKDTGRFSSKRHTGWNTSRVARKEPGEKEEATRAKPVSKGFPAGNRVQKQEPGEEFASGSQGGGTVGANTDKRVGDGGSQRAFLAASVFLLERETRQCAESEVERWKAGDFGVTDFGNGFSKE